MNELSINKQLEIIFRGAEEIIGKEELKKKLNQGKKLRVKFGADPTAPDLHLGHTVVMEKLRQFQELGHKVIFIIGDFTAMIGDPSGQTMERPILTKDEVEESIKGYQNQIEKILITDKPNLIEIVRNSTWLKKLGAEGLIELTKHYTVARMLERNDFGARYKSGNPISITEFIYPLLQGYDSVAVKADIEIGGTDQKFNLLMGRELQKDWGQEPQAILTMPLLEGTDGVKKMSKSYGNHIGISEVPKDIYGKVMSISDELMYRYYELLTNEDIIKVKKRHPRDAKITLAKYLVEKYHGTAAAVFAQKEFIRVFSERKAPSIQAEIPISRGEKLIDVISKLSKTKIFPKELSKTEIKRRIKDGAVTFKGEKISDLNFVFQADSEGIVKVGRRSFFKVTPHKK